MLFISTLTYSQSSLLYEISGGDLEEVSYLFGTIHTQEEGVYNWNDSVFWAIDQCAMGAFEVDLDDGQFDMGEDEKDALEKYLQEDLLPAMMEKISPDTIGVRLVRDILPFYQDLMAKQMDLSNRSYFVDQYLQNYSRKMGKEIHGIESWQEQINALVGSDFSGLTEALMEFLESDDWRVKLNEFPDEQAALINAYSALDADEICVVINRSGDVANNFVQRLYSRIFDDRNDLMFERSIELVRSQSTFIAVGCGHLCGENGLVNQYRAAGYTLRAIDLTGKEEGLGLAWHTYQSDEIKVDIPNTVDSINKVEYNWGGFGAMFGANTSSHNEAFTRLGRAKFKITQDFNSAFADAPYDDHELMDMAEDDIAYESEPEYEGEEIEYATEISYTQEEIDSMMAELEMLMEAAEADMAVSQAEEEAVEDATEAVEMVEDAEIEDMEYEVEMEEPVEEVIVYGDEEEEMDMDYERRPDILPGVPMPDVSPEVEEYMQAISGSVMSEMAKSEVNMMQILMGSIQPPTVDSIGVTIMGEECTAIRSLGFMDNKITCLSPERNGMRFELRVSGDPEVLKSKEVLRFFESFEILN